MPATNKSTNKTTNKPTRAITDIEAAKTHQLTCPHCHQVFDVDESGYANLISQVSRQEVEQEVHEKLAAAAREKEQEYQLSLTKLKSEKEAEIADLTSRAKAKLAELEADKRAKLADLESKKREELAALEFAQQVELADLKSQLENAQTAQELAITKAVSEAEKSRDAKIKSLELERIELQNKLKNQTTEQELKTANLKTQYELELKNKDDMIAYYKDMKARLSTKMIGESLEQHCETEFNQLRATGFRNAYFEKDNAVSKTSGSKGDYIFRECDEAGNEIVSIMFEMKNENETTSTKHKNEDFLKELDKDRREKNCEYAVLVTMLEADSEYYNTGIVDVSHKFDKMYVIRPQFFIPMITLLRNAALNALQYKAELAEVREQNIDITDFEDRINKWKGSFAINSDRATKNFNKAIKEIEDSIKKLENTRDALIQTVKNFETANKKLDDLTIKRLTRGNATMTEKFNSLNISK